MQELAYGRAPPEREEESHPGHGRRQHQGKLNERVQDALATKVERASR